MKLRNLFLTGAAAALALTSCTSLDDNSSWDGQTASTISFKSYINGQKTSRATGTTWAEGDRVGIYMKATGNAVAAATAANKLYITDSKGNMTASSTAEAIAYPESGNVDFVAYYPLSLIHI